MLNANQYTGMRKNENGRRSNCMVERCSMGVRVKIRKLFEVKAICTNVVYGMRGIHLYKQQFVFFGKAKNKYLFITASNFEIHYPYCLDFIGDKFTYRYSK